MKTIITSLVLLIFFLSFRGNAATDSIGFQVIGSVTTAGKLPG